VLRYLSRTNQAKAKPFLQKHKLSEFIQAVKERKIIVKEETSKLKRRKKSAEYH
jgi:hypothetical protein